MRHQPPPPLPYFRFTIRQVMIWTGMAAVLFALAAPAAQTRGWVSAIGYIAAYVLAMVVVVRVFRWME
ncbi:MAG: hypothetical protein ABI353_02135 [Isosphaeraceae bacterium]